MLMNLGFFSAKFLRELLEKILLYPLNFSVLYPTVNKKIVYNINSINYIAVQLLFSSTYQMTSVNINCTGFCSLFFHQRHGEKNIETVS